MALKRLRLTQRRKTAGLTQEALADLLGVERSTVVRWERAETEPQPWFRPRLATALKVTPEELADLLGDVVELPDKRDGFLLVSTVPLDHSLTPTHTVRVMEGFSAHDITSRRDVLAQLSVLSGTALLGPVRGWAAAVPLVTAPASILGMDHIAELRQAVRLFRRWDATGSGGLRRKAVVGQLHAVAESLHDHHPPEVTRALFGVTAELAQLAGWMSYDTGLRLAQRYYLMGLHACREAATPALGAKIISDMAWLSRIRGHYEDTLGLLRTALAILPRSDGALVHCDLLGLEARTYANLGCPDAPDAVRAAEACMEIWEQAGDEPSPDWMGHMDQAEVESLAAGAYIDLALQEAPQARRRSHTERAERLTYSARDRRDPAQARSRVIDEIRVAKLRLAQGEPAEAATVATGSAKLATTIPSPLLADRLLHFNKLLVHRHPNVREVALLQDGLREYVRKAAPTREAELVGVSAEAHRWR